jgi:prepilin-type N-terminal cleavage/methylation domain-containing protein
MAMRHRAAFTLVELLIVVAIIALLAAIAAVNFLEAQTRSKVSRVRADLRTIATVLEAYRVDENDYPPNDTARFSIVPLELTTPVAYITRADLRDPFSVYQTHPVFGDLTNFYSYFKIVDRHEWLTDSMNGKPAPIEAIDDVFFNYRAREKYGKWRLVSKGPDQSYTDPQAADFLRGTDVLYDPTNGTDSKGNLLRTQRHPEGLR